MSTFAGRITLWFSILVTGTTAFLLISGGWLLNRQLIHSIELMHDVEGEELVGLIGPNSDMSVETLSRRIKYDTDSDVALFYIQVHHDNGDLVFRSDNLGEAILPSPFEAGERWKTTVPNLGPLWVSEYRGGPWHIQIASRLTPVRRVVQDYIQVSVLLLAGSAVVSVFLGVGFSRFVLRPVQAIEQTARRIRGDNLGERIPVPPGQDELSGLAVLLNQMFDRLEAAFAQVQRFTADASHELKTPLALVRLNAEKLKSSIAADEEASRLVEELLEQIGTLHRVIETLLFLSKAEGGSLRPQLRTFPLRPWLEDFAEDARVLAEEKAQRFIVSRNEEGNLVGEPQLLRQLLLNLVNNAVRAVPEGGSIVLESYRTTEGWRWTLTDEGPGLADDQLERIFERFVRLPSNGIHASDSGAGLGLSICRVIAAVHGGTIRAENRTDRPGLRIVVEISQSPLSTPRDANRKCAALAPFAT